MDLNVGNVVANLKLNSDQFTAAIKKAKKVFQNSFFEMVSIAKRAATAIATTIRRMALTIVKWLKRLTIAVTAYAVASLKAFASFEDAMVRSAAVTEKATGFMLRAMERTALQMSKSSILSAKELAEGYFALGQAGFTAAQSIKALPVVQDFAIASQVKLDTATRHLVRTLEGLGMASTDAQTNMEQMERVSNSFTFAAIKTTAEIRDFAVAMTHAAAPALRLVNKSMEEGTAVLMAFAKAGIVGEEAGTLLWTTVRDLQRANIKSRYEWEKLGLVIYDTNGKMRNLGEIIGDLEGKFNNMSDETKKISLQMLGFQDRSLRGIQALMGFSNEIKKFEKEMKGLTKLTRDISERYMKSFNAAMIMLWHQVVDVSIAFGKRLAPSMRGLAEDFESSQEVIKKWAVAVADQMAHAIEALRRFVRYVQYDWEGAIRLGTSVILEVFKGFGDSMVVVMLDVGQRAARAFIGMFGKEVGNKLIELESRLMGMSDSWVLSFISKWGFQKIGKQLVSTSVDAALLYGKITDKLTEGYKQGLDQQLDEVHEHTMARIAKLLEESTYDRFRGTTSESQKDMELVLRRMKEYSIEVAHILKESVSPIIKEGKEFLNMFKSEEIKPNVDAEIPGVQKMQETLRVMKGDLEIQLELYDEHIVRRRRLGKLTEILAIYEGQYGEKLYWNFNTLIAYNKTMKEHEELLISIREKQRSFVAFSDQMAEMLDSATNMWQNLGEIATSAMDGLADSIATTLEQSAADWKAFTASVLQQINRMIIKMMLLRAMESAVGMMGNMGGKGPLNPESGSPTMPDYSLSNALGNIFNMGKLVAFAKGGIIGQPTMAPMALMGEAGPEAVMPLTRGPSGELGVKAQQPNINFNPQIKTVIVRDEQEAYLEAMNSAAGEKIIIKKVSRNRRTLR